MAEQIQNESRERNPDFVTRPPLSGGCRAILGFIVALVFFIVRPSEAQVAFFVDGFHGGVYGHYPTNYTEFIVDTLERHPAWKMNLEIEPETWDSVAQWTPSAYEALRKLAADQSTNGRVEFVNPDYGQSYLWNISGECIIQQFHYGMRRIRAHFPEATFLTYSSEEPCFTSALPEILTSYGFKFAVLKNPNTCWGGYTAAHGGGLVNWIGPDGTAIRAAPRYNVESLSARSTWETIAAANSNAYIDAALRDGIAHPVGMCLQDAGWRFGPWLEHFKTTYPTNKYVTWRGYFENISSGDPALDWRFTQEDVHVSLVWGSQILQRIAQEVRRAENRLVAAEKIAAMDYVWNEQSWPQAELDEAWRQLLLAQHHDCWIVPYNRHANGTWADAVAQWTTHTIQASDHIVARSVGALDATAGATTGVYVRIYNTTGSRRVGVAAVAVSTATSRARVVDQNGEEVLSQMTASNGAPVVLFQASVPAVGFATYQIVAGAAARQFNGASVSREADGTVRMESDEYTLILDPGHGGTIRNLVARKLGGRDLIDTTNPRRANELRGYFYEQKKFCSTAEGPAKCDILENGPLRAVVEIHSVLGSNAVTQRITLTQGEPRIDFATRIDWDGSPGIGADAHQAGGYEATQDEKAFYDNRFKLLALFPLALPQQQVWKDAPFDAMESGLPDTFFNKWSEIKNDIILHWVDVYVAKERVWVALLTDHTTSYAHGPDFPLGLTLQYSGIGLWGRHYSMSGPTEATYALLPHRGDWSEALLNKSSDEWNEPLLCQIVPAPAKGVDWTRSLLRCDSEAISITSIRVENSSVVARLFNAADSSASTRVRYFGPAAEADRIELDGRLIAHLPLRQEEQAKAFDVTLPRLGLATIRFRAKSGAP